MTALQNRRIAKGRHPLLKLGSLSQRVFNYIKVEQPGATIQQIATSLHEEYQSVNGCLQRMKGAGLVVTGPVNKGNRIVTGYFAVTENESGHARDVLTFEVRVRVNEFGEYSVEARLAGQSPLAHEGNPQLIHIQDMSVAVPKPTEPTRTRQIFDKDFGRGTPGNKNPLVIEGEVLDIKEK